MGGEFGQFVEWRFAEQLDWSLEEYETHRKMWDYSAALGHFYQEHPSFYEIERELGGEWKGFKSVSYTHLDVYKRQLQISCSTN